MNADTAVDPRELKPGTTVRYKNGELRTLERRKEDASGWWLKEGGGLYDGVWENGDWFVVAEPPDDSNYEPAFRCRRCLHFLLPHDVPGHDKWHDERRR